MYIHAISCVCIFYDILGDIKNKHALANGGEVKSQKLRILEIGVCVCACMCVCVGATPVPKGFYHMSNF